MEELRARIRRDLFAMQDTAYRDFHSALIPSVDPQRVIGVRIPLLRKYARAMRKTQDAADYLSLLPHDYYEEYNLHGFLLEAIPDFDRTVYELNRFLPYVDNWATCDTVSPKSLKKDLTALSSVIEGWMLSDHPYTVRYAIGMRMRYYLNGNFSPAYLPPIAAVKSEEYYVNMMVAWFFATALVKQFDAALPFLTDGRLPIWTHNKTIQKALESYRIPDSRKAFLRTLKIKKQD